VTAWALAGLAAGLATVVAATFLPWMDFGGELEFALSDVSPRTVVVLAVLTVAAGVAAIARRPPAVAALSAAVAAIALERALRMGAVRGDGAEVAAAGAVVIAVSVAALVAAAADRRRLALVCVAAAAAGWALAAVLDGHPEIQVIR
jgi:hypothetical protein